MTEKPLALKLAEIVDTFDELDESLPLEMLSQISVVLRRLHTSEKEGWRYADELEQDRKKLATSNAELIAALNAMLTHMGMDEDEWNKPTFNQARAAIAGATE